MQHPFRARIAAAFTLALVALVAVPAVSSASTLTADGTRLIWTAAPSINNSVGIDDPAAGTVEIATNNDPIVDPLPTGCADTDGDPALPHNTVQCTGYTSGEFLAGDGLDFVNAQSMGDNFMFPVILRGGDDSDDLRGGWASDEVYGEAGDDSWVTGENTGGIDAPGSADIVDGGEGDDSFVSGGPGNDIVRGGDGDDDLRGGQGTDTIEGGAGEDAIRGSAGGDTIDGGDGPDDIYGGCDGQCGNNSDHPQDEGDTINGGAGDDEIYGELGNDTIRGGSGDDYLRGDEGDDNVDGEAGDDYLGQADSDLVGPELDYEGSDPGNDVWNGGSGIDRIIYTVDTYRHGSGHGFEDCSPTRVSVTLTQDGQANDGRPGEADNLGSDVENVEVESACGGNDASAANVTLAGALNTLETDSGPDTANAGDGNDFISTRGGNDTINAVDGFADRVDCGEDDDDLNDDADVANVDEFDQVASNCETVNLTTLNRFATEDAQPVVSWVSPTSDAATLSNGSNLLQVNATDDKGVTQVVFLAGTRVVCVDTAAPYECAYQPTDEDVGKATLVAVAFDASQQTGSALRFVNVDRFELDKLTFKVGPKSDKKFPLKFKARGKLDLPEGVSADEGCRGRVQVRYKNGKKTISTRNAKVKSDCSWSKKVKFSVKSRITTSKLKVLATFLGNDVLAREKAKTRKVGVAKN